MKKNGFSLVELLVVIALVAILVSMIVPYLKNSRARTLQVQCISNLRSSYKLCMLYVSDHDGILPISNPANPGTFDFPFGALMDAYMRRDYLTSSVWYCPGLRDTATSELWMKKGTQSEILFNEFVIGYFYMPNADDHDRWQYPSNKKKYKADFPRHISDTRPGLPFIMDKNTAPRNGASITKAEDVPTWSQFPHHGINRPQTTQILNMSGDVETRPISAMRHGYSFVGASDVYW